ncbi:MAG: hypothetical protein ACLSHU_04825 [Oscillospiraceae bacterium]
MGPVSPGPQGGYKLRRCPEGRGLRPSGGNGQEAGLLLARGEIDTERMARVLLEEFRSCKLGRFTLEMPESPIGQVDLWAYERACWKKGRRWCAAWMRRTGPPGRSVCAAAVILPRDWIWRRPSARPQ